MKRGRRRIARAIWSMTKNDDEAGGLEQNDEAYRGDMDEYY